MGKITSHRPINYGWIFIGKGIQGASRQAHFISSPRSLNAHKHRIESGETMSAL
jgi:hypothetical protein